MSNPLRSALASSLRISSKTSSSRICTANFASSSRHGLDFTRPRMDNFRPKPKPGSSTITIDAPPHLAQGEPSADPTSSSSSIPAADGVPYPTPTPPTAQPIPGFIPRSTVNPTAPPASATPSPTRRSKDDAPPLRYSPIEPLDIPTHASADSGPNTKTNPIGKTRRVTHILHIKCTRNNVHLSFVDSKGNVFGTITAGTDKTFKKSNRSSYEAAHQAALKTFERVLEYSRDNQVQLCVVFNGLMGAGREAVAAAMTGPEGAEFTRLIVKVEDRTPIRIGGDRPRGTRNV